MCKWNLKIGNFWNFNKICDIFIQLWYESNRDIEAGEEIIIDGRPKNLYEHNELMANGEMHNGSSIHSSDDRSERDNGKWKILK